MFCLSVYLRIRHAHIRPRDVEFYILILFSGVWQDLQTLL